MGPISHSRKHYTLNKGKLEAIHRDFVPHSSVGKESACSAGDPSSIPGLGRSAGGGIGYPLQYPWAALVAQLVTNPLAMRGTWI